MSSAIRIQVEIQNHGYWLNVYITYQTDEEMVAKLQNENGEILKKVTLKEGNNSIDISNIKNKIVNLKIETPYETILKKLNLS